MKGGGLSKARVFISCGQNKDTDEVSVARAIADKLEAAGYKPYIAVQEQTLAGLTDNIFARLRESEYMVFVDFKREQLANQSTCRGSLFSHQEVAIAAFLGIGAVAVQEHGVLEQDGMFRFLQANPRKFSVRLDVPDIVMSEIHAQGWDPGWRRGIRLERDPGQFVDAASVLSTGATIDRRFFHVRACNDHRDMMAAAFVNLDNIVPHGLQRIAPVQIRTVEAKWAGYVFPNAVIRPRSFRDFDACWVDRTQPTLAGFNLFSDSSEYTPMIQGPGQFELRYTVFAERFPPQSINLLLTLGESINDAALTPLDR